MASFQRLLPTHASVNFEFFSPALAMLFLILLIPFLCPFIRTEVIRVKGLAVGYLLSKAKQQDDNTTPTKGNNNKKTTRNNKKKAKASSPTAGSPKSKEGEPQHWVVSVEGGSGDEEVIAETLLGKVLEETEESSDDSSQSATFDKTKAVTTKTQDKAAATKGKVTFAAPATKGGGNNKNKKSKKSKASSGNGASKTSSSKTATNRSDDPNDNSQEREILAEWERKRPMPRPKKMDGYDDVVEVSFDTGTLFMYRSAKQRRVEYVARI